MQERTDIRLDYAKPGKKTIPLLAYCIVTGFVGAVVGFAAAFASMFSVFGVLVPWTSLLFAILRLPTRGHDSRWFIISLTMPVCQYVAYGLCWALLRQRSVKWRLSLIATAHVTAVIVAEVLRAFLPL